MISPTLQEQAQAQPTVDVTPPTSEIASKEPVFGEKSREQSLNLQDVPFLNITSTSTVVIEIVKDTEVKVSVEADVRVDVRGDLQTDQTTDQRSEIKARGDRYPEYFFDKEDGEVDISTKPTVPKMLRGKSKKSFLGDTKNVKKIVEDEKDRVKPQRVKEKIEDETKKEEQQKEKLEPEKEKIMIKKENTELKKEKIDFSKDSLESIKKKLELMRKGLKQENKKVEPEKKKVLKKCFFDGPQDQSDSLPQENVSNMPQNEEEQSQKQNELSQTTKSLDSIDEMDGIDNLDDLLEVVRQSLRITKADACVKNDTNLNADTNADPQAQNVPINTPTTDTPTDSCESPPLPYGYNKSGYCILHIGRTPKKMPRHDRQLLDGAIKLQPQVFAELSSIFRNNTSLFYTSPPKDKSPQKPIEIPASSYKTPEKVDRKRKSDKTNNKSGKKILVLSPVKSDQKVREQDLIAARKRKQEIQKEFEEECMRLENVFGNTTFQKVNLRPMLQLLEKNAQQKINTEVFLEVSKTVVQVVYQKVSQVREENLENNEEKHISQDQNNEEEEQRSGKKQQTKEEEKRFEEYKVQ